MSELVPHGIGYIQLVTYKQVLSSGSDKNHTALLSKQQDVICRGIGC